MPKRNSKSICVDFDGTIFDFEYPDVGPIKPGVIDALSRLRASGWWIVISSCRSKQMWQEVYEFNSNGEEVKTPFEVTVTMAGILDAAGVPYDEISMTDKPLARYYVDDRAIRLGCNFCGPDWPTVADRILEDSFAPTLSKNEESS